MNDREIHNLFVYGSLRSGFKSPAYQYVSQFFSFVGNAKVKGKLFDLGSYPAAVPVDEEYFVIGELYTIKHASEFPWAIGQLD
ncbi:MAG TPA: gamma-glutamylcyclotransferase family protein, partial [Chitinophagaceae bacterium]